MPLFDSNYFSLADFRPDEAGRWRRRKFQFSTLHAISHRGDRLQKEGRPRVRSSRWKRSPQREHLHGYALRDQVLQ